LFVSTKNKLLEDQRPAEDTSQEHKGKIILKVGKLVSGKLNKEKCGKSLKLHNEELRDLYSSPSTGCGKKTSPISNGSYKQIKKDTEKIL
jgi:CRISPR/Cas system CSM-associated protein Csm2 small subunit